MNLSQLSSKKMNPACECLFSFTSPDSLLNRPSLGLLCESSPLIFLVCDALRARLDGDGRGGGKGDITAFRQIPYVRKKEAILYKAVETL